jgi:hypothetical protein
MKTILRELFGLFVDDGAFALAILLWLAFVEILTHFEPSIPAGPLLLIGLAGILCHSVSRFARRRTR